MIGLSDINAAPPRPLAGIGAALRDMLGPQASVATNDPRAPQEGVLLPAEAESVRRATPARRREFASGRAAARAAMQALGHDPHPVPRGADRAPLWPPGLTGSISHTSTLCVAAVAETGALPGIGIDIEEDSGLAPDLVPEITTLAERAWLAIQPEAERGFLAKLIFSAKECAYKCQYSASGALFGFDTLEITPDPDSGQFEATFLRDVAPFAAGACLHGRFARIGGLIVTATALPRRPRWSARGEPSCARR
ncbi:4'-phosphopantetheinyl transferase superfamily protein [Roseovarius spongiae]|uniref:Enterobactin synthase component D n=1 Tax=Roseovarius spongiae TaxID=2320272 RepID=A0A3A8B6P6_9RHOB|nr:4'-phosphopantetheinyl transferase superfamily protein [Roseovarius spongiae]RKF16925.1 4'-phosphopantetheinyl transferase superfamily protein [Roseovarius spongiae]